MDKNMLDRYRGCLIGGAVGDALGYAVEFSDESGIFHRYGPGGITEYALTNGVAQISDDTQMTLFTAAGFLKTEGDPIENVWKCYQEWLTTQEHSDHADSENFSGLMDVPELWSPRAPGNTCIGAISGGIPGRIDHPINNRKGCGGVMRAAPAGLISPGAARTKDAVFGTDPAVPAQPDKALNAAIYGAELSALTHGGDLGWLPGAMLAHMVSQLVSGEAESIWDAANNALIAIPYEYTAAPNLQAFTDLMSEAMELADGEMTDLEAIHQLGEGWVGDEAMAIALFCALRHEDDFAAGVIAAVNHKGDSDSTGAIAGNLLGAFLGYDAIPETFQKNLELHDVIVRMADALCERAGKDEEHE